MSAHFDYIIVGAGIVGATMARYLAEAGKKVLVLEAGTGRAGEPAVYDEFVADYYTQLAKVPNSAYPANPHAPSPSVLDITQNLAAIRNGGWFVPDPLPEKEKLTQWFGSDYLRMAGGTALHWLGTCLRMLPHDFKMKTLYDRGADWPIGYDELMRDYARAEWEIGVSADKHEQEYLGVHFPHGYHYPMHHIPPTVVSQKLSRAIAGLTVRLGHGAYAGDYEVRIISTPQGRNSTPHPDYRPRGRVRIVRYATHPLAGEHGRPEGAMIGGEGGNTRAYFEQIGERCEGNSSCIPICPVQAKYNPLKTMAWALRTGNVEVWPQHVVTRVVFDAMGKVRGLEVRRYPGGGEARPLPVTADRYILALNSIENAKLMLASYLEDERFRDRAPHLGKNLMDHPFVLTWGEADEELGTYRAPSSTAGIETLRDGAFRRQFSAFRIEVGNWGWDLPIGDPYTTTQSLINGDPTRPPLFGEKLREQLRARLQRQVRLGALIEQLPSKDNRVEVNRAWRDSFGELRPVIHYGFTDYEIEAFDQYKRVSDAVFAKANVVDRTDWTIQGAGQPIVKDGKPVGDYKWMGAGHLVGTHKMGTSLEDGVVDTHQKSFLHDNLYLAGGGSMCTIGTSNPTLTIVALAFRTLSHLRGHALKGELPDPLFASEAREVAT